MMRERKRITKDERLAVFNKTNGKCAYCGCELTIKNMQVDHVESLALGGENSIENYLPSCRSCNFYKDTMPLEVFRSELGKLLQRLNDRVVIYRIARRYGLISENDHPIKFYFEQLEEDE